MLFPLLYLSLSLPLSLPLSLTSAHAGSDEGMTKKERGRQKKTENHDVTKNQKVWGETPTVENARIPNSENGRKRRAKSTERGEREIEYIHTETNMPI